MVSSRKFFKEFGTKKVEVGEYGVTEAFLKFGVEET